MSTQSNALIDEIRKLNTNVIILAKVLALDVGKEVFFKTKKQKEEQAEYLTETGFPREIVALVIGSTPESVRKLSGQKKPKEKSTQSMDLSEQVEQ